ncbi:DoxX-like protein [Cellulophaga sp. RHA19]|uniref:DoxX family protein n=1 Tax=Cellulophaga sp. RHA19 TaxID=1798237 RepID=UPI000C2B5723|nr:DoxX family protein [Cellulophaga sp. RHA19]PKB42808.1 DoxX-like protein [Cellulophaga sp. RHA19]
MNINNILYWIGTLLLTAIMCFSIYNYFFNYDAISGYFTHLGYPTYLVYPLAIAKILGLIVIWTNFSKILKEWAYFGFFLNTIMAFAAHYITDNGGYLFAAIAFIGAALSYYFGKNQRP